MVVSARMEEVEEGTGGRPTTSYTLSDLDLTKRRPDRPRLEKRGSEAGVGDVVAPGEDGYNGVLRVDSGEWLLGQSHAATAT